MISGESKKSSIPLELPMKITHVIAYMNGNIFLYHMLLLKLVFKGF